MPRKAKTATAAPDSEKRVTRRSLRGGSPDPPAKVEEPKPRATRTKAAPKAAKSTPSPARGGRRGAKGRGRGQKATKKEESSDEGEEESIEEDKSAGGDQPSEKASPSPKKTVSPKKDDDVTKDEDVPEDKMEEDKTEEDKPEEEAPVTEEASPVKSRRTRGSPRAAALPKSPPSRRSGRGAAKVATEKIGDQAAGEGAAEEEEEPLEATSPRRGRKRKSADGHGSPLKRQKTEDGEKSEEQSMETEEPVVGGEGSGEGEAEEDVEMKTAEDGNVEPAQPQGDVVGKTAEPSEKSSMKPAEPQEDAKTEAAGPSEEAKMEATGPKEEAKGEEPRRPVGEAAGPSAEEASGASVQEASEASVGEASGPSAEEASGPSAVEASGPTVAEPEDILKDFVVVNKDEMPASDSPAIAAALPKEHVPKEASPQKRVETTPRPVPAVVVTAPEPTVPVVEEPEPVAPQPVAQPLPPAQVAAPIDVSSNGNASDAPTQQTASVNSNHAVNAAPVANNLSTDDLFAREFVRNKSLTGVAVDSTKLFSVASYNVLAECHALRCAKEGSYAWMSADQLLTDARHKRLLAEFTYLDADILCLQEVGRDYFSSTLQPAFLKLGYEGVFIKRNDLSVDEGEATFYRSSQFTLVNSRGVVLSQLAFSELETSSLDEAVKKSVRAAIESPSVAMLTQLRSNSSGRTLTVANIHVSYERFQRPDLQCVQAACAIKELVSMAGGADQPHLICGDFNSLPTSPVYQLTREGYLNDLSMAKLQALPTVQMADGKIMALVNLWWHIFQHTSNNMRSAYDTVLGSEPVTTKSPSEGTMAAVDYMWYASKTINVDGVLRTPSEDLIQKGIPNATFPSDHLSIKAVLAFK